MITSGDQEARRGRPRNDACTDEILQATIELVAEVGLAGMTVDAVAARAGVGKATIYRRWPSKEELLLEAWRSRVPPPEVPDTGTLEGDLLSFLVLLAPTEESRRQSTFPHMIAAARINPEVRVRFQEFVSARREPVRSILRRGIERGELPADTDVEVLYDLVMAPFFYRWLISDGPIDPAAIESWVTMALRGATTPR